MSPCVYMLIHSFIICLVDIDHRPVCARHCSRLWGYSREQGSEFLPSGHSQSGGRYGWEDQRPVRTQGGECCAWSLPWGCSWPLPDCGIDSAPLVFPSLTLPQLLRQQQGQRGGATCLGYTGGPRVESRTLTPCPGAHTVQLWAYYSAVLSHSFLIC